VIVPPELTLVSVFPILLLAITGLAALLIGTGRGASAALTGRLSLLGTALAIDATIVLWGRPPGRFPGALVLDRYALLLHLVLLSSCALTILFSFADIDRIRRRSGEYYSLLLFATVGMMVLVAGTNLLVVFLGLEVLSISLYVLAGFHRERQESIEAAMKYFVLGAFSTCFILYGIAFLYGAFGTLDLVELGRTLSRLVGGAPAGYLQAGLALLIVGFGFKVAAAPFHFWAPDVYQGSPTTITGFMATATKAAAIGALLRILHLSFSHSAVRDTWVAAFSLLAIATMAVGNLVALAQEDVKRLLAYSSIAHAGYLLIAIATASEAGLRGILFYLFSYTFMTLGAFGIVGLIGRGDGQEEPFAHRLQDYAGLGYRRPFLAALMSLFMLSLTGIPPTAGFMGKFYIFRAAVGSGQMTLAILGVVFSAISAYYYLQVIVFMYMREPMRETRDSRLTPAGAAGLLVAAAATLYLGLFPTRLWDLVANLLRGA
jgi:NADH-quinone oxidoreductase subunit N